MPIQRLQHAKRIVVKVGSNVLTARNDLNTSVIEAISNQICLLIDKGLEVLLVSSGAMAAGLRRMRLNKRPDAIPQRQAISAMGQSGLMYAYEEAFGALFNELDRIEARLTTQRYLMGKRLTEADWRLFTTLVRFDPVYVGHFKCNRQRIADYAHLSGYLRELYQVPGVAETVDLDHIKRHYYASHATINPTGVVPKGPSLDLDKPHGREAL